MRCLQIVILLGVSVLFLLYGREGRADAEFDTEFKQTFESLLKDKETAKWVDKVLYDLIRHGLDRKVANILAEDDFVKKHRNLIDQQLQLIGDYSRNLMRSSAAEAMYAKEGEAGQYTGIRNHAQRLAKFFNFTREMRSNLSVFIWDSPMVNAFAFPSLNTIQITLLTGLIEKFNEANAPITEVNDMIKSVIAHELAHVKNKHGEHRLIVILIFLITHKNVIPSSMQESFRAMIKDQAMRSLYRIDTQQALASEQAATYHELFDTSWEIVENLAEQLQVMAQQDANAFNALQTKLKGTFAAYDVAAIANDTALTEVDTQPRALSASEVQAAQKLLARYDLTLPPELQQLEAVEGEKATEAGEKSSVATAGGEASFGSFVDLIRFVLALSKLSRSQEVTCDRFSQIATSEQTLRNTFARMGGGRDASSEAMMRQAEKWAEELNKVPLLQKVINEMLLSHPVLLMRIHQTGLFSKSFALNVHKSMLYKALALYMEGVKILEASEKTLQGESKPTYGHNPSANESVADSKETYELFLETEKATPFKKMVEDIGKVVVDSIISESATSSSDLQIDRFVELIDFLQMVKRDRGDSAVPKKRLSTPGTEEKVEGLLYTVNHRLRNLDLPENSQTPDKLVQDALQLLRPFQPSDMTWQLDKDTNTWRQIESSTSDTQRRNLEDFRRSYEHRTEANIAARRAGDQARRRR